MSRQRGSTAGPPVIVAWLSMLIAGLAALAAGAGLLEGGDAGERTITSVRGEVVELYGRGLYRNDSLFAAGGQQGTDVIVIALAVPALLGALLWSRKEPLRGGLVLAAALAFLFYVYASMALGTVAYNDLFLVYVALFSATLFALILTLRSIDPQELGDRISTGRARVWTVQFLIFAGSVTLVVWLMDPLATMIAGDTPDRLDTYTTLVTHALDIAIIVPLCFLAAALVRRGDPLGYLIAFALLGIIVLLGPTFVVQTIGQVRAGVDFSTAELIGPIAGFGLIALLATVLLISLMGSIAQPNLTSSS